MDSNSWFYTLSAIPQTLAAMIALTATFIVYKLTRLKDFLSKHTDQVKIFLPHLVPEENITDPGSVFEERVAELLQRGLGKLDPKKDDLGSSKYADLKNSFDSFAASHRLHLVANKENIYLFLQNKLQLINTLISKKQQANKTLMFSLAATTVPIALSIMLLPLYGSIGSKDLLLALMIIISCFSVAYTAYAVWKISNL